MSVCLIITVTQTLSCWSLCLPPNFRVIAPQLGEKMKQTTRYYYDYYFNTEALKSIFHNGIKQFLTEGYTPLHQTSSSILKWPKEFVLNMLWGNKRINKYFQLFSITIYLFFLSLLFLKNHQIIKTFKRIYLEDCHTEDDILQKGASLYIQLIDSFHTTKTVFVFYSETKTNFIISS